MTKMNSVPTSEVDTAATVPWSVQSSMTSPTRNRKRASWRSMGMMMTMPPTRHRFKLFKRYCLIRADSRDVPDTPMLISWSHCLTMSAIDAEAREQTKLENHSELIQTADNGARKGGLRSASDSGLSVELRKDGLREKLLSCADIF